jgi:predicted signal transduction protein with EAL and GGDEF domain
MSAPFALGAREVFVTASIGVVVAPLDGSEVSVLLRNAESALDYVKKEGGNGFRCHSAGLDAMARRWLDLEAGLHRAVEREELSVSYQPQVELESRRETAREALLRWNRPGAGAVPPTEFVPVAEESRLIGPDRRLGDASGLPRGRALGRLRDARRP